MSEAEAYLRIHAARVAREYPSVIPLLASGEVNLSTLKLMGPVLTAANHSQLLERVRGKKKREVELIVSELAPRSDVRGRMRKLPGRRAALSLPLPAAGIEREPASAAGEAKSMVPTAVLARASSFGDAARASSFGDAARAAERGDGVRVVNVEASAPAVEMDGQRDFVLGAPRVQRSSCVALRPGRYKLQLTASQALHDKLEQLQHLLRHQVPGGELATIVERAVDLLLATTLNRRFAQKHAERAPQASTSVERAEPAGRVTSRERATPVEPAGTSKAVAASKDRRKTQSRYVPRAVVREVYARDEGQCTFVSSNARRCSERGALELHHVIPFGLGGPTTVDNLRIVCRAHNALFAERDFGADHIRLKRSQHHSTQQTITHTRL